VVQSSGKFQNSYFIQKKTFEFKLNQPRSHSKDDLWKGCHYPQTFRGEVTKDELSKYGVKLYQNSIRFAVNCEVTTEKIIRDLIFQRVESLQSHMILTMSHWSSGLTSLLPATRDPGSNPLGGTYVKPGFSC
jgi:hypothetical protein